MKESLIHQTQRKNYRKHLWLFVAGCLILGSIFNASAATATPETTIETGTATTATGMPEERITTQLQEKIDNASEQEIISVAIWYNDIDYNEVKSTVEKETGLTIKSLDTDLTMPKEALLEKIQKLSEGDDKALIEAIRLDMEDYLQQTSEEREHERSLTNTYIMAERQVARSMYAEHNEALIKASHLGKEKIFFTSSYAPMILANLTVSEIKELAKKEQVEQLFYYEDVKGVDCSYSSAQQASNIDLVKNMGLTGTGVSIGVVENGYPDDPSLDFTIINYGSSFSANPHATNTVNILSRYTHNNVTGVAPNADIYCTNATTYQNIETMISQYPVNLINVSWGYSTDYGYNSADDYWFDHLSAKHAVTLVCAAGNYCNLNVAAPAKCYNAIAVGAFDDNGTAETSDDTLREGSGDSGSSYLSLVKKPDLLASSNLGFQGTSSATPLVTGSVALMLELKPSLAASPQTIKAILIAACQRKVGSNVTETMAQGITERQGAGVFDAYSAITIIGRRQYVCREFSNADLFVFEQPPYGGDWINTGIAWFQDSSVSGTNHSYVYPAMVYNLKLQIFDGSMLVHESDNLTSSTEMAYFSSVIRSGRYTVRIFNNLNYADTVSYSFAWSVKNATYRNNSNFEGIYYISNKAANYKYTTNDNGDGKINSLYTGYEQQWVIKKRTIPANSYTIRSNADSNYLDVGNSTGTSGSYYAVADTIQKVIFLDEQTDGSFIISTLGSGEFRSLGLLNGNSSNGAQLCWSTDTGADAQRWYLEKANFAFGDINMNGVVNASDTQLIMQFIAGNYTPSASELYLADANGDGDVTMADVLYVQQAIAGTPGYPL